MVLKYHAVVIYSVYIFFNNHFNLVGFNFMSLCIKYTFPSKSLGSFFFLFSKDALN